MLSCTHSGSLIGIEAHPVLVEVNSEERGEPVIILVGLPDAAVKESQNRIFSAMSNSGFKMPKERTTVNLAPGNIKKEGTLYDLPIALGLLAATKQIPSENCLNDYIIAGELSLSGSLRSIRGGLALGLLAKNTGKRGVILPPISAKEAALVEGIEILAAESLDQTANFFRGKAQLEHLDNKTVIEDMRNAGKGNSPCFSDVKGQHSVRRAIEIAVAGGHNILIIGPPGSGKSMISKRIPSIMPDADLDEFLEILAIHSAAGQIKEEQPTFTRPFRSPHHTISDVGLLGGGTTPGPGEISMAHNGVLFLDELPEYKRSALEVMRQPLEDRQVTITRSAGSITIPANFMLVAAMNPCACGYLGSNEQQCRCSTTQVARYRSRISGPLLDRIDIHIDAPALSLKELQSQESGESSSSIKSRVEQCRAIQKERYQSKPASTQRNADLSSKELRQYCSIQPEDSNILEKAMTELSLSARAYDRILKVARTIADLAESKVIQTPHLLEAIQYRSLDRNLF